MSPRRILVTGGSGFLGSGLVKALVRQGEAVRVFDDNSRGALRRLREIERDIEFVSGDIRDAAAVDAAMRGQIASTQTRGTKAVMVSTSAARTISSR